MLRNVMSSGCHMEVHNVALTFIDDANFFLFKKTKVFIYLVLRIQPRVKYFTELHLRPDF